MDQTTKRVFQWPIRAHRVQLVDVFQIPWLVITKHADKPLKYNLLLLLI